MKEKSTGEILRYRKRAAYRKKLLIIVIVFAVFALLSIFPLYRHGIIRFSAAEAKGVEASFEESYTDYADSARAGPAALIKLGSPFPGQGEDARDGHLPNMTAEEIALQEQKQADPARPEYKINLSPVFKRENARGELAIENPSCNACPMVVQLELAASKEVIYDSGGLLPNRHILSARLFKRLEAGAYLVKAHIYFYDPDLNICTAEATKELTLTVQ